MFVDHFCLKLKCTNDKKQRQRLVAAQLARRIEAMDPSNGTIFFIERFDISYKWMQIAVKFKMQHNLHGFVSFFFNFREQGSMAGMHLYDSDGSERHEDVHEKTNI